MRSSHYCGRNIHVYCLHNVAHLLLCSGGIHPNPGPTSNSSSSVTSLSTSSSSMSTTVFDSLPLNHNVSFVHYNVQSILPKLEILHAELHEFDILAFSETWLNPSIDNEASAIPGASA